MGTRARERGAALADAIKTEKRLRPEAALSLWQAALLASVLAALAAYVSGQSDWRAWRSAWCLSTSGLLGVCLTLFALLTPLVPRWRLSVTWGRSV